MGVLDRKKIGSAKFSPGKLWRTPTSWLSRRYPLLITVFIGFCIADLLILNFRDEMLPQKPPPSHPPLSMGDILKFKSRDFYDSITVRNMFSAQGKIPDALVSKDGPDGGKGTDDTPQPTALPLELRGTIVHSNPKKSIANIEVKAKKEVMAFSPDRDIDGVATLLNVERFRAYIRNRNNGRLEYIEMKEGKTGISFSPSSSSSKLLPPEGPTTGGGEDVKVTGSNQYEVKRSDVQKYLSDLNSVLQQAAMQPCRKPSGEIEGYRFVHIKPGIISQLGFQSGDCVKSINGEPIDSPAKAMELFNMFRNSNSLRVTMDREGREQDMNYSVK